MAYDAQHKLEPSPELVRQITDPRDSVNDQAVVDAMVRNFAKSVADELDKLWSYETSSQAADGTVHAAAHEAAKPFMGGDPKFATTEWNTPEQLGKSLQARGVNVAPHLAVEQRFHNLAGDISNAYSAHARGSITDEQAQRAVNYACDHCTYDLLGIPDELRPGYVAPAKARRG